MRRIQPSSRYASRVAGGSTFYFSPLDHTMSIEQRRVVDFVGTSKTGGRVILTIADHLPWLQDNKHLLILQDKINDYLSFLQSGEIYDSYPQAHGREIEIQVICKYPPAGDGVRFLELASETVRKAGFYFSTQIFEGASHDVA